MKVEKTYKELLGFQAEIQQLLKRVNVTDNALPVVQLNRLVKKIFKDVVETHEDKMEDLRLKLCIRDKNTFAKVLNDKGEYQYTEENEKRFRTESREIENQPIEVHYNEALSYQELLELIDKKQHPFIAWEDVKENLEPFYFWKDEPTN